MVSADIIYVIAGIISSSILLVSSAMKRKARPNGPRLGVSGNNFEFFWRKLTNELRGGQPIRNWTRDHGYVGEDFIARCEAEDYVTCDAQGASGPLKVPKDDFRLIYDNWVAYLSGKIPRSWFAHGKIADSRFTKYTISIVHQYAHLIPQEQGESVVQEETTGSFFAPIVQKDAYNIQVGEVNLQIGRDLAERLTKAARIADEAVGPEALLHRDLLSCVKEADKKMEKAHIPEKERLLLFYLKTDDVFEKCLYSSQWAEFRYSLLALKTILRKDILGYLTEDFERYLERSTAFIKDKGSLPVHLVEEWKSMRKPLVSLIGVAVEAS